MKDLKAFCEKYNLTEAQATGKEKINGSLDLSSVTTIHDGFNPTVGGSLDLSSGEKYIGASVPDVYFWRDKKYIKADGIFQEVVSHRGMARMLSNHFSINTGEGNTSPQLLWDIA